jgi:hypothetical protein
LRRCSLFYRFFRRGHLNKLKINRLLSKSTLKLTHFVEQKFTKKDNFLK